MKLVFSEARSDYQHYVYTYAIWGFPEPGETPETFYRNGFLPGTPTLQRFYICRQIRVDLAAYQPSSENRRILRKCQGISLKLITRAEFEYSPEIREFFHSFAEERFGKNVMPYERLDTLFHAPVISHLLVYTEQSSGRPVGYAALYLEGGKMAHYYYAFYDLNYFDRSLGMYMMTSAVEFFAREKFTHLYLGTCYSQKALYKFQFKGCEFFNGHRWSDSLEELRYLLERDQKNLPQHLLEHADYRELYCGNDLTAVAQKSAFQTTPGQG